MLLTTDTELTRRAFEGDPEAFTRIYDASFPCVWSFAARRRSSGAAAEVLTELILSRVFRELGRYDGEVPFAAWLLALCKDTTPARQPPTPARHGSEAGEFGGNSRSRR